jgi:hypothetical protein
MDSSTGSPLFNMGAWAKAKNIFKEISRDAFLTHQAFDDFYTLQLNDKGTPKTAKHGIQLIACP